MTAKEAVAKFGSLTKASKALGVSRQAIRERDRRGEPVETPTATKPAAQGSVAARPLSAFRAEYDKAFIVPSKVRAALRAMGAGWAYEVDFARAAGVSLADLGRFRDQFAEHVVQIGRDSRRAWAGTAATATAMREMLA